MDAATAGRQRHGQGDLVGVPVATGVHATLEDLARAKGINATYANRILRLTLLAPYIVEAILDGRQPDGLRLEDLMKGVPLAWE